MISLIGDLLDLSRIESGSANMEPKAVNLAELLKSVVEFLDLKAKSKKQILWVILPEKKLPELNMDPMALENIFGNLITNAANQN